MTSFAAAVFVAFALGTTFAPWRRPTWKRPSTALQLELATLVVALAAWHLFTDHLTLPSLRPVWGRVALLFAAYWYACAGGITLVRVVLGLVPVGERPGAEGIAVSAKELARGRIIGVLERALALTLVLAGQYGALGLIVAAKALTRFRALEDRDFAEYVLIGTLASLLLALMVGVGVKLLL